MSTMVKPAEVVDYTRTEGENQPPSDPGRTATLESASPGVYPMRSIVLCAFATAISVQAADVKLSRQQSDSFNTKVFQIAALGGQRTAQNSARRTPITEAELNSWFAFHGQPLVPQGIAEPAISMVGQGRVSGRAIVDLDVVAKKRASGGVLDPWSYIGGKMPVSVTGLLHTRDGVGRFQLETADVSGVPVPKVVLQEVVAYYTRTEDHPRGVNMEDPFELPAGIRQIEVGAGQAVVVQ
jgi:hypothetical protein